MEGRDWQQLLEESRPAIAVAACAGPAAPPPLELADATSSSDGGGEDEGVGSGFNSPALPPTSPPSGSHSPSASAAAGPASHPSQATLALPVPAEADEVIRCSTAFGRAAAAALCGEVRAGALSGNAARWALMTLCASVRRRAWQAAGGEHAAIAAARVRSASRDASHEASRARNRLGEAAQGRGMVLPGGRKFAARGRAANLGAARMIMVPADPPEPCETDGTQLGCAGQDRSQQARERPAKRPRVTEVRQWKVRVLPTNDDAIRVWATGQLPEDGPTRPRFPTKHATARAAHRAADAVARQVQDDWPRQQQHGRRGLGKAGSVFSQATAGAVPLSAPPLSAAARTPSVLKLAADTDVAASPRALVGSATVSRHCAGLASDSRLRLIGKRVDVAGQSLELADCRPAPPPPLRSWPTGPASE